MWCKPTTRPCSYVVEDRKQTMAMFEVKGSRHVEASRQSTTFLVERENIWQETQHGDEDGSRQG